VYGRHTDHCTLLAYVTLLVRAVFPRLRVPGLQCALLSHTQGTLIVILPYELHILSMLGTGHVAVPGGRSFPGTRWSSHVCQNAETYVAHMIVVPSAARGASMRFPGDASYLLRTTCLYWVSVVVYFIDCFSCVHDEQQQRLI